MKTTKSGLARELGCSPGSITRLISIGMPVLNDGRLDREKSLGWIAHNTSGRGGGWGDSEGRGAGLVERAEGLLVGSKPVSDTNSANEGPEFWRGASWLAREFCGSARQVWPKALAGLKFDTNEAATPATRRAFWLALMLNLSEGWLAPYIADGDKLPAVNWRVFGKDAAEVQEGCEALLAEWRATEPTKKGQAR